VVRQHVRVVKVGGSLLEFEQLPAKLVYWLEKQTTASNVLIAGGGELAECVRRFDATFQIGETASHWLCVDVLGITARMLFSLLPNAEFATSLEVLRSQLNADLRNSLIVFDVAPFLRQEAMMTGQSIPRSWDATSDSIAARLCAVIEADELVLLKSSLPTNATSKAAAVVNGYVDRFFCEATRHLPKVRCVNLRDQEMKESILTD